MEGGHKVKEKPVLTPSFFFEKKLLKDNIKWVTKKEEPPSFGHLLSHF